MLHILKIELEQFRSLRNIIPLISITLVITALCFINILVAKGDYSTSVDLAKMANQRILSSSLIGLFFIIWIMQHLTNYWRTGYYQMLVTFGITRHQLYLYQTLQYGVYLILFSFIEFISISLAGLFFGIWPWDIVISTDINAWLSQLLFLFSLSLIAGVLASLKSNYLLALPLLFYWLMEGWVVSLIQKHYEWTIQLPLESIKAIISHQILSNIQLLSIGVLILLLNTLFYRLLQKKSLA